MTNSNRSVIPGNHVRIFVRFHADAMTCAVHEPLAKTSCIDDTA